MSGSTMSEAKSTTNYMALWTLVAVYIRSKQTNPESLILSIPKADTLADVSL